MVALRVEPLSLEQNWRVVGRLALLHALLAVVLVPIFALTDSDNLPWSAVFALAITWGLFVELVAVWTVYQFGLRCERFARWGLWICGGFGLALSGYLTFSVTAWMYDDYPPLSMILVAFQTLTTTGAPAVLGFALGTVLNAVKKA